MSAARGMIMIAIFLAGLGGCTAGWQGSRVAPEGPDLFAPAYARQLALDQQARGELRQALATWRVVDRKSTV